MRDLLPTLPALALRPISASVPVEPMIAMQARAAALVEIVNRAPVSEEEQDAAYNEMAQLRDAASAVPVGSLPGALATLTWARDEFALCAVLEPDPNPGDVWQLAMLDKVLGLLRQTVEGGAS